MRLEIKPKGGLYIFGLVFLYVFFSLFPIGAGIIMVYETIDTPLFYLCFVIEIPFYMLITIDVVRYKIVISDEEITIPSNKTCIDMLFHKKKKKYNLIGLRAIQLQKGIIPFEGYTVKYVLI